MAKIRFLIFFFLIFVGCKIEIESPYEDADGISIEYLQTYSVSGDKFIFFGDTLITKQYSWIDFYDIRLSLELPDFSFTEFVNDFALLDKYIVAALSDSMIKVLNFSKLEYIYVVDSLKLEDECKSIILKGTNAFVLSTNKIFIIDCSDINNLNMIKTLQFDCEIFNFVYDREKLYVNTGEKCLIVDVKNPAFPYQSDSLMLVSYSEMLNVNKNFIYSISWSSFEVYNLTSRQREWTLRFANQLKNVSFFEKFGIAISSSGSAYLLNFEYPARPAILELIEYGGTRYGTIRDDEIYLLTSDGLKVFLIEKTD